METSSTKKKIIIISGIALVLIAVSWILYMLIPKEEPFVPTNTVIIDNSGNYNQGITDEVFLSIGKATYATMGKNDFSLKDVYHGVVRDDTFKRNSSSVAFILDIESERVSWKVVQGIDEGGNEFSDASVSCIDESEAIYPILKNCRDINNGFKTPEQQKFTEMTRILPLTGFTYAVEFETTKDNELGYTLIITTYTPTGRTDAAEAFLSLGYDINEYPAIYIEK